MFKNFYSKGFWFNFHHSTPNNNQRLTHPNLYEIYAEWYVVIPSINAGVHRCNDMGCIANDSMYITLLQHLYVQVVLYYVDLN